MQPPTSKPKPSTQRRQFALVPVDPERMLRPGTISYCFDMECDDPAEALMIEMPTDLFLDTRDSLEQFVRDELQVPLVVVLIDDDDRDNDAA